MSDNETLLDDFRVAGVWTAIAPGATELTLTMLPSAEGGGLRLDYDLGGNGFVIARRPLSLTLPEDYCFVLDCRGNGAQHIVEFKLVDDGLANVWRLRDEQFLMHDDWTSWRITAQDIGYAWGARRARRIEHCDALEIAIVGAGRGSLWLRDLRLRDRTCRDAPRISASLALPGCEAHNVLVNDDREWRIDGPGEQTLTLNFDTARAFSAVQMIWSPDLLPTAFAIDVEDEAGAWHCRHHSNARPAPHTTVLLPGTRTRALRLRVSADEDGAGLRHIEFAPWYYAPDLLTGLSSLALAAAPGHYPKALREQQSYWTVIGAVGGGGVALTNTEGLVEVDGGEFAIEAVVRIGERLYTWADVTLGADLVEQSLPLPRVFWQGEGFTLCIAPTMVGSAGSATLALNYQLTSDAPIDAPVTLYVLVRPYLVTPVWQLWQGRGGFAPITCLRGDRNGVLINDARRVLLSQAADAFGVQDFAAGDLIAALRAGHQPSLQLVEDDQGLAQALFAFDAPRGAALDLNITALIPTRNAPAMTTPPPADTAANEWRAALGASPITLPVAHAAPIHTLRVAAAHILVNRDGARLQPGPRRYIRAYLRDAVGMGTALARLGIVQPLKDLMDWYGPHQRADGELPDAIDDDGPEWLPEYDAYGQYLHGVAEAQRLAPEPAFIARQWPTVQRVLARFEALRATRTVESCRDTARFGVLPESMSHEGYMAQPVHAYWDDFWALRGLHDAAWLATQVGDDKEAQRIATLATTFASDLHRSIALTMSTHAIEFIPGSVELGDFDATAIAVALTVGDDGAQLPQAALHATFDRYLAIRAERATSNTWSNYSAYEVRIVGALLRMGRRDDALRVMHELLADCRPPAWRQWPEQSWREMDAPAFLGDLPHSWIGAEYIHALCSAFAHERRDDTSLVLAAGVDARWLADGGLTVSGLRTHYGALSYRLHFDQRGEVEMEIDAGIDLPRGGLVLCPPLATSLRAVSVNGLAHTDFNGSHCRLHALPAHIVFHCEEARP